MSEQKINFKEKISEFFSDLKKDKKKMFFVVLIPILLIGTIVAGIFLKEDETVDTQSQQTEKALVVPVSESLEDDKKSKKSDLYKRDFFDLNEDKGDESNSDSSGLIIDAPVSKQSNKGSYSSSVNSSKSSAVVKRNLSEINNEIAPPEKGSNEVNPNVSGTKRSRVPSDNSGNMSFGNKKLGSNYRAVVANGNRTVKAGSYVKIRIAEDIDVDGMVLSKNSVVSGLAGISDERLSINVTSVKIGNTTKAVDWSVYDEDGNFGVAIPRNIIDAIAADVGEDAIEDGGTKIEGTVPVVGSVKMNLKRKAKMIEFVIPDGHRVLIKKGK